jgi:hypothetical protein
MAISDFPQQLAMYSLSSKRAEKVFSDGHCSSGNSIHPLTLCRRSYKYHHLLYQWRYGTCEVGFDKSSLTSCISEKLGWSLKIFENPPRIIGIWNVIL